MSVCVECGAAAELRSLWVDGRLVASADACDTHWLAYVLRANARAHLVNELVAAGCSRTDADRVVDQTLEGRDT